MLRSIALYWERTSRIIALGLVAFITRHYGRQKPAVLRLAVISSTVVFSQINPKGILRPCTFHCSSTNGCDFSETASLEQEQILMRPWACPRPRPPPRIRLTCCPKLLSFWFCAAILLFHFEPPAYELPHPYDEIFSSFPCLISTKMNAPHRFAASACAPGADPKPRSRPPRLHPVT